MGLPYVYRIENENGEYYFGVRWNYNDIPETDLWINYFTSSDTIKKLINKNGKESFKAQILNVVECKKKALDIEYNLIKENSKNPKCLNRSLGKCTIWDEELKSRVSKTMKEKWQDDVFKKQGSLRVTGSKNHNYGKKPWNNVNSDIVSWLKLPKIFTDFCNESWNFNQYGYGREFLMKRYGIAQGTSRKIISLLKNNYNPFEDKEFLVFLDNNTQVS